MTETRIQDDILDKYEVRKSNQEKTEFIEYMRVRLGAAGYEYGKDMNVEEKGNGLFKSRNIVVGNPEKAKILIGAHYDTCAVLPFPNLMTPTNPVLYILFQVVLLAGLFGAFLLLDVLLALIIGDAAIASLIMIVALYGFLFHMLFGYRNKHTANDNTSGIITITKILENLPEEDRHKVCVIYFDNEEKGLLGSDFFYSKHKKQVKDKLLINFDCVGDGRDVVFIGKLAARRDAEYQKLIETCRTDAREYDVEFLSRNMKPMMFGSDQMHFRKGVGVCALRKSPLGRYAARIHTPWDTRCRQVNVEFLSRALCEYLKGTGME